MNEKLEELEEHEIIDEDGIILTDVRFSKSSGVGVNLNVTAKKSKQEKELKKSTVSRVKRLQ